MINNFDEFMEYGVRCGKALLRDLNISQDSAWPCFLMMNFNFFRA